MEPVVDGATQQSEPPVQIDTQEVERLRLQDLANIRAKVRLGQPLSAEQLARLQQAGSGAAAAANSSDVFVSNQTALVEALGLESRKTIQRWSRKAGCPGALPDGRYNVTAWRNWMQSNNLGRGRKQGPDIEDVKNQSAVVELRMKQLELEEMEGRSISREEATQVMMAVMTKVAQTFRQLKHGLAPSVVGESVAEASKRIGQAVDEVLSLMSIPEAEKKKPFWRSVSAMLSDHLRELLSTSTPESTSDCTMETAGTPI